MGQMNTCSVCSEPQLGVHYHEPEYEEEYEEEYVTLSDRVQAGVDLLDRVFGVDVWKDYIIPDSLDLASETRCVVGQIYGKINYSDYHNGWRELYNSDHVEHYQTPVDFGFEVNGESYPELTDAWLEVI